MLLDRNPINNPKPAEEHVEEYRDVTFAVRRPQAGGALVTVLEGGHHRLLMGQYFSRYMTNAELAEDQDMAKAIQAARNGIDRLHSRSPVYTGDIRYRYAHDN